MAQQFYYSKQGVNHGPVSPAQLKQLAATGQFGPDDLVQQAGSPEWVKAGQVKGLFPAPPPAPPPNPDPAPAALPPPDPPQPQTSEWDQFLGAISSPSSSPSPTAPRKPFVKPKKKESNFWNVLACISLAFALIRGCMFVMGSGHSLACPSCGRTIDVSDRVCPKCGHSGTLTIEKNAGGLQVRCSNCGQSHFVACPNCGYN